LINIAVTFPAGSRYSRPAGAAGSTCVASLAAGSNCSINVVFSPSALGASNSSVAITGNVTVSGSPVALTGTGVVPDAIFSDGFESGNTSAWSSASTGNTTRLNVTAAAALLGNFGLQAQGNNTNYVQENFGTTLNPVTPTYDAQFVFRPNGNNSAGKDIFAAATATAFGTTVFHVRYRLNAGTPQVQVQVGATANAAWTNVLGGTANNIIEVVWQAAGSGPPNPGTLRLYVNGVLSQSLPTTSTSSIGAVRLGSVTATGNATLMFFDAFASKRSPSPPIGP